MPDRHAIVHAWEARPGSGERGPDGRVAGEFTLSDALYDSFRFTVSRQIVGEIRGPEVWPMIKAMESGSGSISTTHSADALGAMRKLITCAMESGPQVTHELATLKLAETIDLIVQLDMDIDTRPDGTVRRRRWVSEIVAISPGEQQKGYAADHRVRRRPRHPGRRGADPAGRAAPAGAVRVRPGRVPHPGPHRRGDRMNGLLPAVAGGLIAAGILGIIASLRPAPVQRVDRARAGRRPCCAGCARSGRAPGCWP